MSNGHLSTRHWDLWTNETRNFAFVLSLNLMQNGSAHFALHVRVKAEDATLSTPTELLSLLGFQEYAGSCRYFDRNCLYVAPFRMAAAGPGVEHSERANKVVEWAQRFASGSDELLDLWRRQRFIGGKQIDRLWPRNVMNESTEVTIDLDNVPTWLHLEKFPKLVLLEKQRAELDRQISELNSFLPLIYGTGDFLENAVVSAMEFLGFRAERTPHGFNIDVLAESSDHTKRIGIEVTGTEGNIKKRSNKITQLFQFEQENEDRRKGVLIANTWKSTPVDERAGREDFTETALELLVPHPFPLMTGLDLFRMVGDVLEECRSKSEIVDLLWLSQGRLKYSPCSQRQ